MLFDWFTVGAQVLNFLILVWLLKRFLYKPILDAIDAREKRIATEITNADAVMAEGQKEREEFRRKNEEFDEQRAGLLSKATNDANVERQRLLEEARQAADALRAKRQDALQREQQGLSSEISHRTRNEVFAIARKALTDLAGTGLEERLVAVFTRRLRALDGAPRDNLARALKTSTAPALVRSAFDLPAEQRAAVQQALNEAFSAEISVQFETAPDVISGIELTANGQKVAWSIADYLASVEKSVSESLQEPTPSAATPETTTEPAP